jgi:hypothetical protein
VLRQATNSGELQHRWVHFKICDVHIPEPARVLRDLYGENLLQGRVMEVSKSGGETFAVVDVEGIPTPVIIAVDRILGVL